MGTFDHYVDLEIKQNPLFRTYTYSVTEFAGSKIPIVAFTIQPIDIDLRTQLYEILPNINDQSILESDKIIPIESFKVVNSKMPYLNYLRVEHFELVKHIFDRFHYQEVPSDPHVFLFSSRHTRAPGQDMNVEM